MANYKSILFKFKAPRAQSSQAPLSKSASDWKVQFDVHDEGVSVKERQHPSEIVVVSGWGSPPAGATWSMRTKTLIGLFCLSTWTRSGLACYQRLLEKMDKYNKLAIEL